MPGTNWELGRDCVPVRTQTIHIYIQNMLTITSLLRIFSISLWQCNHNWLLQGHICFLISAMLKMFICLSLATCTIQFVSTEQQRTDLEHWYGFVDIVVDDDEIEIMLVGVLKQIRFFLQSFQTLILMEETINFQYSGLCSISKSRKTNILLENKFPPARN